MPPNWHPTIADRFSTVLQVGRSGFEGRLHVFALFACLRYATCCRHKFKREWVENNRSVLLRFQVRQRFRWWLNLGFKTYVCDYTVFRNRPQSYCSSHFHAITCNARSDLFFLLAFQFMPEAISAANTVYFQMRHITRENSVKSSGMESGAV